MICIGQERQREIENREGTLKDSLINHLVSQSSECLALNRSTRATRRAVGVDPSSRMDLKDS